MYIQFYQIFKTVVILGKFKINGKTYTFRTNASATKAEALEKFFQGYEDAKVLLKPVTLKVKSVDDFKRFTFMYEKKDFTRNLRVVNLVS